MEKILIVVPDKKENNLLSAFLHEDGVTIVSAFDLQEGLDYVNTFKFSLIISNCISTNDNFVLLKDVKATSPDTAFIILSDTATTEENVKAIKLGADDIIKKPYKIEEIRLAIKKARGKRLNIAKEEHGSFKEKMQAEYYLQGIRVQSPKMQQLIKALPKIADSHSNILIKGEIGTGRKYLAETIHHISPRSTNNFVSIHCADDRLESKLLGYKDPANSRQGLFEIANGGTIFLDQIIEMPAKIQLKLFLVLKDKVFRRIGVSTNIKFDVRLICTSNKDLLAAVSNGDFRDDLYYELKLISVTLPPLRERKEDIPLLVDFFLNKYCSEHKIPFKIIPDNIIEMLVKYPWKGNIKELENTIFRAIVFCNGETINTEDISLNQACIETRIESLPMDGTLEDTVKEALKIAEPQRIRKALQETNGNKSRAAKILQVSYKTLLTKMKVYGIE